jgi:hypothetical protein
LEVGSRQHQDWQRNTRLRMLIPNQR